jgi:hypothetical protein
MIPPGYPPMPYYAAPGGAPYAPPPHMQAPPGYNPHLHPMFQHPPPQPLPSQHIAPAQPMPRPVSSAGPVQDIKGGDPGSHDMSNPRVRPWCRNSCILIDTCCRRSPRALALPPTSFQTLSSDHSLSTGKISPLVPMASYLDATPSRPRQHFNTMLTNGCPFLWTVTASLHPRLPPVLHLPCRSSCRKIANWSGISWMSTLNVSTSIDLSFYVMNLTWPLTISTRARRNNMTQVSYAPCTLYSHLGPSRSSITAHAGSTGKADPSRVEVALHPYPVSMLRPSCHPNGLNTSHSSSVPLPSNPSFESRLAACKHSFFCIGTCTLRYVISFVCTDFLTF